MVFCLGGRHQSLEMFCSNLQKFKIETYHNLIGCFRFDLVDVTRQFMVNVAPKFYHLAIEAFHNKDVKGLSLNAYFGDSLKNTFS